MRKEHFFHFFKRSFPASVPLPNRMEALEWLMARIAEIISQNAAVPNQSHVFPI